MAIESRWEGSLSLRPILRYKDHPPNFNGERGCHHRQKLNCSAEGECSYAAHCPVKGISSSAWPVKIPLVPVPRHPTQCRSPSSACQWRIGWFAPSASALLGVAPPTLRRPFGSRPASSPDPRCGGPLSMSYTAAGTVSLHRRPAGEVIPCSIRRPSPRHPECANNFPLCTLTSCNARVTKHTSPRPSSTGRSTVARGDDGEGHDREAVLPGQR